ncbi:MAG: HAD-IIA family hydrolase [Thermoleophilia bacterium]
MALTHIDGLLLDMDGVLGVSWRPLSGAAAAVARLRAAGVPMRVITNTTARSRAQLGSGLREHGFAFPDDEVLSAAAAAGDYLRTERPGGRVFLLGDAQAADLEGIELVGLDEHPDLILISGADDSFTFENLNRVYRALLAGAELVAMHRNLSWMTQAGVCLDAGAYLLGLESAAGREAVVVGKPAPRSFLGGLASLGLPAGRVAMVGDDVANDVLAAQAVGLTGVLVRTGKFREDLLAAASGTPDHIIGSIADLPALLGR